MKLNIQSTIKTSFFLGLLCTQSTSFAITPVSGLYGGIILGGSYQPSIPLDFSHPQTKNPLTGSLTYSFLGDIALQMGYRFHYNYRVEGEMLFNASPYNQLKVGTFKVSSATTNGLRMKGQTYTGALMANAYYDFLTPTADCNIAPYVGVGAGYAYIRNNIKFYYNNLVITNTNLTQSNSAAAVQGIIGTNYFLDEFTSFGLDFRYFTAKTVAPFESRLKIESVNITFNGMYDCG